MTTTSQHHLQPTMTMHVQRHHHADSQYRTTHASKPLKPVLTGTCHLFEEASGPAAATSC